MLRSLNSLTPVSLDTLSAVRLMNRMDVKYAASAELLGKLLDTCRDGFLVLDINGSRLLPYNSLYFDTDCLDMYMMHHNGHLNRFKVRTREYMQSGECFLEVKMKDNHGRTRKKRCPIPENLTDDFRSSDAAMGFVRERSSFDPDSLSPALWTKFNRITLTDKGLSERVTIDTDIVFSNCRTGRDAALEGLAIIEVKQDRTKRSLMADKLRALSIMPLGISKYCIGTVLTDPDAKSNRFKEKIRILNKIKSEKI